MEDVFEACEAALAKLGRPLTRAGYRVLRASLIHAEAAGRASVQTPLTPPPPAQEASASAPPES